MNSCGGAIKRQQGPNSEGRREAAMHGKGHASHAAHNEARLGGRQFSANNSPWPADGGRPSVRVASQFQISNGFFTGLLGMHA